MKKIQKRVEKTSKPAKSVLLLENDQKIDKNAEKSEKQRKSQKNTKTKQHREKSQKASNTSNLVTPLSAHIGSISCVMLC